MPKSPSDRVHFDIGPNGVSKAGVALFGNDSKFVADGRNRIASMVEHVNQLTVTITFAAQEKNLRVVGYATPTND